ncbi:MAG: integrase arm-type DNA-binding domain-containing protein [Bdellovibrionales bacterium]
MPLSDAACRNAKPKITRYKLSDHDGLSLRVMPHGGKYWIFRFRYGGKEKELSLGAYPTVTLAGARASREKARQLLKDGVDPVLDRGAQKLKLKTSVQDSFEAVAREWIKLKKQKLKPRYISQIERRLESDVFPQIGQFPCKAITASMMLSVLKKVQTRGVLETALRLKEYCSSIFHFAIVCEKAEKDPTASLRDALPTPTKQHFAAIDPAELPEMLLKMSDNTISVGVQTRLAMRALLLTFVRTRELVEAKKEEINFETARWVIPAARMKMKRDHIVPLSRQALEIFKMLKQLSRGEYVFPGQHSQHKPMSNMAILMALKRMGYKGKMTGHGFRALATTTLREVLEYPKELTDIQLAHAKGKTDAAYDRAKFLKERTEMMQSWADYIDKTENLAKANQKTN